MMWDHFTFRNGEKCKKEKTGEDDSILEDEVCSGSDMVKKESTPTVRFYTVYQNKMWFKKNTVNCSIQQVSK